MPITELAILRLTTATFENPTDFYKALKRAKEVQERASGYPAYYFHQVEDPFYVYIVGSWDSVQDHLSFLPKQENQEVLELVRKFIIGSELTMFHIEMSIASKSSLFTHSILNINRYIVDSEPSRARLSTKPIPVPEYAVGGWAIEELSDSPSGQHREEFILFSGWESERDVTIPCPGEIFKHPLIVETNHAKRIPLENF